MVATGGFKQKTQLESLRQELDVLIATPGRFMFLVRERFLELTNIKRFVVLHTSLFIYKHNCDKSSMMSLHACALSLGSLSRFFLKSFLKAYSSVLGLFEK